MLRRMRRPAPELQHGGGVAQLWPFDWVVVQVWSRLCPQAPISPAHSPTQSSSSRLLLIAKTPFCRRSCSLVFHAGSRVSRVFTSASLSSQTSFEASTTFGKATSRFSWPKMLDLLVHRTSCKLGGITLSYKKPKQQMHRHDISHGTRMASETSRRGLHPLYACFQGKNKIQPHFLILLVIITAAPIRHTHLPPMHETLITSAWDPQPSSS